jgi:diguanylate cyclase (GGDEF)-like protein
MRSVAEKLRAAIREAALPHDASPHRRVTVSIGVTVVDPAAWVNLDAAYQRADQALYRAKDAGRDRVEAG